MKSKKYKAHLKALENYNAWEKTKPVPDRDVCFSMINNLYELLPPERRHRAIDVSGIIIMRQALSSLKHFSHDPS